MNSICTSGSRRRGAVAGGVETLLAVVLTAAVPQSAWGGPGGQQSEIVGRGTLEPAAGAVVRCEVAPRDAAGITILKIVPEGKRVKPGDLLVTLDSSHLQEELAGREMDAADSAAAVQRAQMACRMASLAGEEYSKGIDPLERLALENEIFVAERRRQRADKGLEALEERAEEDVASREMEDARFNAETARRALGLAKLRLEVLTKYTMPKRLMQFQVEIEATRAELAAAETRLRLAHQRLAWIKSQIEMCGIQAPAAGTVVYAGGWARAEGGIVIRQGVRVRLRQPILRIDDLTRLQVQVQRLRSGAAIKPGMPAKIRVDAFPDRNFDGSVVAVEASPPASRQPGVQAGQQVAVVRIDQPPPELRSGMTAEVRIVLEPDAD